MYKVVKTAHVIPAAKQYQIRYESPNWKKWKTHITQNTCFNCFILNGRIFAADSPIWLTIPVHDNCRCSAESVTAIAAGTATSAGKDGVDFYVFLFGCLPSNYITKQEAEAAGWKRWRGNLDEVLPGKIIGGDIYHNLNHHLPETKGRVWYEADFDYDGGYRNGCRLLYSNDGLIFITYDHYLTFHEIGTGG